MRVLLLLESTFIQHPGKFISEHALNNSSTLYFCYKRRNKRPWLKPNMLSLYNMLSARADVQFVISAEHGSAVAWKQVKVLIRPKKGLVSFLLASLSKMTDHPLTAYEDTFPRPLGHHIKSIVKCFSCTYRASYELLLEFQLFMNFRVEQICQNELTSPLKSLWGIFF